MKTQILTTDYAAYQLAEYPLAMLEAAKELVTRKAKFYQDEINRGYSSPSNIELYKIFCADRIEWVKVVQAAKARDAKNKAQEDAYYAAL